VILGKRWEPVNGRKDVIIAAVEVKV